MQIDDLRDIDILIWVLRYLLKRKHSLGGSWRNFKDEPEEQYHVVWQIEQRVVAGREQTEQ